MRPKVVTTFCRLQNPQKTPPLSRGALKQRYRDHFFHQIEVCLIGHCLLLSRREEKSTDTLADYILKQCDKANAGALKDATVEEPASTTTHQTVRQHVPATKADLLANWWLAALTHDTAYGIDVLQGTLDLLSYFSNSGPMREFQAAAKACVAKLGEDLKSTFKEQLPELDGDHLEKGDHGVITAGHLVASFKNFATQDLERFLPAVRAVAFHNTRHPKVNAAADPVAALLILCDTLQDWGRSQLGFTSSPADVLSRIVEGSASPGDEQFGPVESYSFTMRPVESAAGPGHPAEHVWESPEALKIKLKYARWMTDKPDCRDKVLFGWADTTYNLQRVDFSPWGLDLRVVHRTPFAQKAKRQMSRLPYDEQMATELERFAAMVREMHAFRLERWKNAAASNAPDSPLSHKVEPPLEKSKPGDSDAECGWEELEFRLRGMGAAYLKGEPLMAGHQGEFAKTLNDWSKRLTPSADKLAKPNPPV